MRKVSNIRTPHFLLETESGEEFGRVQIEGNYYGATVQLAAGDIEQSGSSSLAYDLTGYGRGRQTTPLGPLHYLFGRMAVIRGFMEPVAD